MVSPLGRINPSNNIRGMATNDVVALHVRFFFSRSHGDGDDVVLERWMIWILIVGLFGQHAL